jgi:hypothetical protein
MDLCKECGIEPVPQVAGRSFGHFCFKCLEKAMENLTMSDIAGAMDDIVAKIDREAGQDIAAADEALADFDQNGGTSLDDLKKELGL